MQKRDIAYLLFFTTHLPIILLIDTTPLQPTSFQTTLSSQLRGYYISTYRDKFFELAPPPWFTAFLWMEVLYHIPASLWAVWGLVKEHPLLPVHLLVFGVQAFVTSVACLVEVWAWEDRTVLEKQNLTMLYGPYVMLGAYMAIDAVLRLRSQLMPKHKRE